MGRAVALSAWSSMLGRYDHPTHILLCACHHPCRVFLVLKAPCAFLSVTCGKCSLSTLLTDSVPAS